MYLPKSFPDLPSLDYSLTYAEGIADAEAVKKLTRIKSRSTAHGTGYGTHLPLLAAITSIARGGPILELGAGNFSTLMLNVVGRAQGRKIYTLDADMEWLNQFDDLNDDPAHIFLYVGDKWKGWTTEVDGLPDKEFAVAFVDQTPPQCRIESILHLRDKAEFIVVHDTNNTFFAGVDEVLESFQYKHTYSRMVPSTTVVSMTRAIPNL